MLINSKTKCVICQLEILNNYIKKITIQFVRCTVPEFYDRFRNCYFIKMGCKFIVETLHWK